MANSRLMSVSDAVPAFLFCTEKTRTLFILDNALVPIAEVGERKVRKPLDHSFRTVNFIIGGEEWKELEAKRKSSGLSWQRYILKIAGVKV